MSKQAYEQDIIAALGEISGMHKLLYITLWSRANEAGIVHVNMDQILGLTGIRYQEEDFTHFGNRLVSLNDKEMLLTRYLSTVYGTLSAKAPVQSKFWKIAEKYWRATKENPVPLWEAWRELKVEMFLPEMTDEYIGEHKLPPRIVEFRKKLLLAKSVDTPHTWPKKIADEFKGFINFLFDTAWEKTSKTDTNNFALAPSQVMTLQAIVQDMLDDDVSEKKIISQIRYSKNNNKKTIYVP